MRRAESRKRSCPSVGSRGLDERSSAQARSTVQYHHVKRGSGSCGFVINVEPRARLPRCQVPGWLPACPPQQRSFSDSNPDDGQGKGRALAVGGVSRAADTAHRPRPSAGQQQQQLQQPATSNQQPRSQCA